MRVPRPSAEDQKKQVEQVVLTKASIHAGDTWFIISTKWFESWEGYVQNLTDELPGPIDNSPLVNEDQTLRRGTEEHRDYELIAEDAWNLLYQWYSGGPPLPRKAIQLKHRGLIIEVRLLTINFSHKEKGVATLGCSKGDTIGDIKKNICEKWSIDASQVEVVEADGTAVDDMSKQLSELHIVDGQKIYLTDTKMTIGDDLPKASDSNGTEDVATHPMSVSTYPSSSTYSSYSPYSGTSSYSPSYSSYPSYSFYDQKPKYPPPTPGLVGLNNLGNTCFMNSALQCLSNTGPLSDFFLSGAYRHDINEENPLGTKGKLAEEFARLIKDLWTGSHSAVAPRDFKARLERFASQFTGYQQHDSQELLAFLLDGLHEDLNRVKKKVYASVREGDDIPDDERAKEAWEIHKNRNDSVVVDWFQASLKSTLVCPTCSRVSVTFDPFMYLSLPLPMKMDRSVPLTLLTLDVTKPPTKYLVKVPKTGTIATLKARLGEMAGISPDCLIVTDVFNNKFFKKFADSENIDSFDEERDVLFAYEVLPQPADDSKLVHCAVYNRKDERNPHYPSLTSSALFGTPFFVSVPSDATYQTLYEALKTAVSRWFKQDAAVPPSHNDAAEHSEGEEEEVMSEENGDSATLRSSEGQTRLFTMHSIDSHGYHETPMYESDAPLDLEGRTTIAIHWKPESLELLGDTKFWVNHSSMHTVDPTDPDGITLDKCLTLYTTTERLGPDDPWYCNRCKEHKQATKKFDLWSAPRILVVHLKRFSYRNKYFREKLETLVSCPLRGLDLSGHIIGPVDYAPIYDLYAVSNHYGSLGGGHYTAFALNKSTNKWYKFDDSYVSEVDESQVVSSSAYVLFYRRRDTIALSSVPAHLLDKNSDNEDEEPETQDRPETQDKPVPRASSTMELD